MNPRIRKNFSVVMHSPDLVEIKSGVWNVFSHVIEDETKKGKLYEIVKHLLDGHASASQIAKESGVNRSVVEEVIDQLTQLGAIEHSSTNAYDYFLNELAIKKTYSDNDSKLKKPILLIGPPSLLSLEMKRILNLDIQTFDPTSLLNQNSNWKDNGFEFEKMISQFELWKDFFWVFAQDTVNPPLADSINRIASALQISWFHVAVDGPFLFVGPLFKGNCGPCYRCFETRVAMNLREKENYQKYKYALAKSQVHFPNRPHLNPIHSLAGSIAAIEILNFLFTENAHTVKKVLSIYLPTMEIVYNDVLQLSNCEICSTVMHREKQQLYFDIQTLLR